MVKTGDEGIRNKFFWDLKRLFNNKPEVDGLLRGLQNLGLKSNQIGSSSDDSNELTSDGDDSIGNRHMQYPIRPDAEDCPFFIRTGTCKFGPTCKFNHPVLTENLGNSNENGVKSSSKNLSQIPCKFYLTGICKYGESCRFHHSKSETEKSPVQLNVIGLPKRWGEINCSFYMRTGMCRYGSSCRFHHPDPIFVFEPELYSSIVTDESMNNHKEASKSTQSYLSLPQITTDSLLYVHQNCVMSEYQEPECKQEVEIVEDYPEKPPKREPCHLSDVGLPIRPGKKVCWNYKNLGLCKLGRACAYDHPKKPISIDGLTSQSLSPSAENTQE